MLRQKAMAIIISRISHSRFPLITIKRCLKHTKSENKKKKLQSFRPAILQGNPLTHDVFFTHKIGKNSLASQRRTFAFSEASVFRKGFSVHQSTSSIIPPWRVQEPIKEDDTKFRISNWTQQKKTGVQPAKFREAVKNEIRGKYLYMYVNILYRCMYICIHLCIHLFIVVICHVHVYVNIYIYISSICLVLYLRILRTHIQLTNSQPERSSEIKATCPWLVVRASSWRR